jgi:hypothetical protein
MSASALALVQETGFTEAKLASAGDRFRDAWTKIQVGKGCEERGKAGRIMWEGDRRVWTCGQTCLPARHCCCWVPGTWESMKRQSWNLGGSLEGSLTRGVRGYGRRTSGTRGPGRAWWPRLRCR